LIASEKDLRHVLSSTADVFYVIDRDYRITLINEMAKKNLARAWGRPVRAGASILDLIPDEKDEPIRKSFDRVFAGEKIEYELHNQAKQDLPEWVSVSYKPVIDNDGTVIGAYIVTRDITERKKAESEVRKSEERYRSLIEQASDYIMITDQKGNFIDVNSSLCKEFGYKREELLKMNISSLIDPLQLKHDPIRFDLLITGAAMLRERRMMNKDGSVIEVEANVKMLPDGRILAIARDIRERKQIEQELKEAEIKFRNLVEQSLVGVYIIQDGKFAYVNPRFAEIFGYSQQELINAYPVEIVVHPDDRATVTENIRERLQGEKDSVHYEVNGQKKDGEIVKIEIFGSRTQYLGNPAIIGTLLDITERQQAQQALITSEETRRLIMDSALDAIVSMDTRGHITAWTPQAEKIFGWKENEVIGKTIADTIIPVQYRERHKKGLEKYLQTGEGPVLNKIIEISALKRDGTGFPIELSIIPVKQGETEFFCAFIRDITERKKAEEELLKSEERYRILVENATEALVVMDVTKKKFISVSESAVKLFGMTKEYLLSVGPIEVSPEYQPDGRLSSEAAMEKIGEAIAGGKPSFEWMHCDKNGKLIPCEVWLVRLPAEDQILVRGSIIDITERKKAEKQITESYAHIRQLTEHLQNIREEERIHIAREIHDELGQQLTVLKMDASWLNKKLASAENTVKQKLQGLLDLLDSTVKTVRRISSELRPSLLDDMGLVAAMEWHLKEFENRSALKVRFTTPEKELSLPDAVKTGLFRIFQESLTNVARHADAKKIEISLQPKNGNIILSIRDDGRGFEKEKVAGKKTLGILGMKERSFMMGGSYEITSTPGKGTFVVVSVPYGN
jgi:PAS domain S-box-containing protein